MVLSVTMLRRFCSLRRAYTSVVFTLLLGACGTQRHGDETPATTAAAGTPKADSKSTAPSPPASVPRPHTPAPTTDPQPRPRTMSHAIGNLAAWSRDQGPLSKLKRWDGRIVIHSSRGFHQLNLTTKQLEPIAFKPCAGAEVAQVSHFAVLCVAGNKRSLWMKRGDAWSESPLPPAVAAKDTWIAMESSKDWTAILGAEDLHVIEKGTWTSTHIGKPPGKFGGFPSVTLIDGDRLLLGYDRGEWGGELLQLNKTKATWKPYKLPGDDVDIGVRQLLPRRNGGPLAIFGLAHLSLRYGIVARVEGDQLNKEVSNKDSSFPWPKAAFQSATYDADGSLYLLTGSEGILVRSQDNTWTKLTKNWNHFVYVSGLLVTSDTAIIATYDAGIALWPLYGGKVERVRVPRR